MQACSFSDLSLLCHLKINCTGQENIGNDHQFEKLRFVKQILLVSTRGYKKLNSMENLHTDVRCKRLKMYFTPEQPSEEVIFQLCLVTEDQLSFPTAI